MRPGEERLKVEPLLRRRMIGAHQDHELVAQQHDPGHPRRRLGELADREVGPVLVQECCHDLAVDVADHDRDAGRSRAERGDHRRGEDELGIVRHAEREALLCSGGIEGPVERRGRAHGIERRTDRARQLAGQGGRFHAGGRALEQVIPERGPQAPERVAGRGLGEAEPGRGAGDVALGPERLEDAQQVEVEPVKVHGRHLQPEWWRWKCRIS